MNPKGNPQNLKPFTSEYQPKNKGPKKSKLREFIQENDIGRRDIEVISRCFLDYSRDRLKELVLDDTIPILVSGVAKALLDDLKRGRTDTLRWLQDRGIGQSTQVVESTNRNISAADMNPEERDKLLLSLLEKLKGENESNS